MLQGKRPFWGAARLARGAAANENLTMRSICLRPVGARPRMQAPSPAGQQESLVGSRISQMFKTFSITAITLKCRRKLVSLRG